MSTHPLNPISLISPDILLNAMQNVALSPGTDTAYSDDSPPPLRPFVSYTHAQLLFLYKSPLVSPPPGMPLLKDWFGYAIPHTPFSISCLYHPSETGMNKVPRKRIPIPLLPPQEPGINGMYCVRCNLWLRHSDFSSVSGVIRRMLVHSSPPSFYSFVHSPPLQQSFPHAPPSVQR